MLAKIREKSWFLEENILMRSDILRYDNKLNSHRVKRFLTLHLPSVGSISTSVTIFTLGQALGCKLHPWYILNLPRVRYNIANILTRCDTSYISNDLRNCYLIRYRSEKSIPPSFWSKCGRNSYSSRVLIQNIVGLIQWK